MKNIATSWFLAAFLAAIVMIGALATGRAAVPLQREPPEGEMRLGQRVKVDDGSCPPGQVLEITASKLTPQGIVRTRTCVKR